MDHPSRYCDLLQGFLASHFRTWRPFDGPAGKAPKGRAVFSRLDGAIIVPFVSIVQLAVFGGCDSVLGRNRFGKWRICLLGSSFGTAKTAQSVRFRFGTKWLFAAFPFVSVAASLVMKAEAHPSLEAHLWFSGNERSSLGGRCQMTGAIPFGPGNILASRLLGRVDI
jgi:hypothetical protein